MLHSNLHIKFVLFFFQSSELSPTENKRIWHIIRTLCWLHLHTVFPRMSANFEVSVPIWTWHSLKDSDFIGIFYCFSNFGTILIIIKRFRFYRNLLLFFEFRYYPYYYYYYYYYYSFFFRTRDCHRKSPKPHHIQPPNSTHIWTLIRHIAVRVSVLIRITVLDLEPDPCFQIFLNIS